MHEHEWTWRWFGEHASGQDLPELIGLRTCDCGAFERVIPTKGLTPDMEARIQAAEAEREAKRVRQREYTAKRRAAARG